MTYNGFLVYPESENYQSEFSFLSGDPDNDLGDFSGNQFSTFDKDNDSSGDENCAKKCGAGFWFNNCDVERGTINQSPASVCGGFSWDKPNPSIILKATELHLVCSPDV